MDIAVLLFLTSGLFLGWSLGANDAANVFGTAVGSGVVRFRTAALITGVFVILGAVISGSGTTQTLGDLGSVNALPGAFTAAAAAGFTVYWMTRAGVPVSTTQAIVGAIIGWNLFSQSVTDTRVLFKIVGTWMICPVLAGLIAAALLHLLAVFLKTRSIHLLRLDAYTRLALIVVGAFGAYSLGANNIANVVGVFVPVSPFTDFRIGGFFNFTSVQQLFLLGGLAIAIGVFTYSKKVMLTVGAEILPLSPLAAWVAVLAHSIVLFVFASQGLEHLLAQAGLPTIPLVPVSSSQAVVGAVVGIGLLKRGRTIQWPLLAQIGAGWVATPIAAAAICFLSLFVLQNVFDQRVYRPVSYELTPRVMARLEAAGFPIEGIANLKGREFESARSIAGSLSERIPLTPEMRSQALTYAEVFHTSFFPIRLASMAPEELSPQQLAALRQLSGRSYRHKWQVADALAQRAPEWRLRPDTTVNKLHNRRIQRQLEFVYRTFGVGG